MHVSEKIKKEENKVVLFVEYELKCGYALIKQ